jgi:ComF family protein
MLADYLSENPLPGEVLVPVPLHARRLRERGYNQSCLLARELGRITSLPVVENCLTRRRDTMPQARTSGIDERREHVSGAFECGDGLRGEHVILIDDVTTSGATLNACAGALKYAGAASVWGLTVASDI